MGRILASLAVASLFALGCSQSPTSPTPVAAPSFSATGCNVNADNNPPTTASNNNCTTNNNNNNNNNTNNNNNNNNSNASNNPPTTAN